MEKQLYENKNKQKTKRDTERDTETDRQRQRQRQIETERDRETDRLDKRQSHCQNLSWNTYVRHIWTFNKSNTITHFIKSVQIWREGRKSNKHETKLFRLLADPVCNWFALSSSKGKKSADYHNRFRCQY